MYCYGVYGAVTPDWRPYRVLNCHILENADGRIENANDFSKINPDFGQPSHRSSVLCDLCMYTAFPTRPYRVLTASLEFLLSLHGVTAASIRRSAATPLRPHCVLSVSTTTLPRAWRSHGDCRATQRRPRCEYKTPLFFRKASFIILLSSVEVTHFNVYAF